MCVCVCVQMGCVHVRHARCPSRTRELLGSESRLRKSSGMPGPRARLSLCALSRFLSFSRLCSSPRRSCGEVFGEPEGEATADEHADEPTLPVEKDES